MPQPSLADLVRTPVDRVLIGFALLMIVVSLLITVLR